MAIENQPRPFTDPLSEATDEEEWIQRIINISQQKKGAAHFKQLCQNDLHREIQKMKPLTKK